MKIIEPGYEILRPSPFNGREILSFLELAGRTCYKSENKITEDSAEAFVTMLCRRGHESVLEHVAVSVRFTIDRGVSHELVRHRLASYSQESSRYCNYGKGGEVTFIRPPFWKDGDPRYLRWVSAMQHAEEAYLALINGDAKPEEARSVLPNSLKTEVVMTANLREWRLVFKQRTALAAHPQMRQVMQPLLKDFHKVLSPVFKDLLQDPQ